MSCLESAYNLIPLFASSPGAIKRCGFHMGNSTVTELQIRDFGLSFNHFVLYSYDLSQFEYFYKVQRYPCHHLKHKICQSSLLFRDQGPVSQRVAINRTMDIHRSSMTNCVQPFLKRGPGGICESVTKLPEN